MEMPRPLDESDIEWLREYECAVTNHFHQRFCTHAARFALGERLVARFSESVAEVLKQGRASFRAVDEVHNELAVAEAILVDPAYVNATLHYEPKMENTSKSVDFLLENADGRNLAIDVKTVKPCAIDRWDQYQKAIEEGWFPKNVLFSLWQDAEGGQLWHYAFASRCRFLEYSLELEAKAAFAGLASGNNRCMLMFCGEGFYWRQDQLEDFVEFYRTGKHRSDDPFAIAETRSNKKKGIRLAHNISVFGCLDRRQGDIVHRRVNWNVQPPRDSFSG